MGLQINFPDRTAGICTNAYVLIDTELSNEKKNGNIIIKVWRSKDLRDNSRMMINKYNVTVLNEEEKFDEENGTINSLSYDDFIWKNGYEIYTKMKTLKLFVGDEIIDLSDSNDELTVKQVTDNTVFIKRIADELLANTIK